MRGAVPRSLRGVFVGSGGDGLNEPSGTVTKAILGLVEAKRAAEGVVLGAGGPPIVAYIGTATYDRAGPKTRQTGQLADAGCRVEQVFLVEELFTSAQRPDAAEATGVASDAYLRDLLLTRADVVVVSGGNTLYATDTWKRRGVDALLRAAMERGAVLAGGSAGAIWIFEGGHSDSGDPTSFLRHELTPLPASSEGRRAFPPFTPTDAARKAWAYLRVPGLAFLPGLCCPHFDRVQSNGVLRAEDFEEMLRSRFSGERGVGIDHWAALVVAGEGRYSVLRIPDKTGSQLPPLLHPGSDDRARFSPGADGRPGVWLLDVDDGAARLTVPPDEGDLDDLVRECRGSLVEDNRIAALRAVNVGFL
eukprot:TRINITY_DN8248_c0_g1_i1.p1 TRINITY_DN8248_c0_g1~~TRINITY_DN8248_c0_g1_i1.p1  ORF type:complete len:362 (+),score=47.29 TRINITY_DN8248_c0_g1_i1:2089-3174(+)